MCFLCILWRCIPTHFSCTTRGETRCSPARERAVAQLGSALEWGSRGRGFESRQPEFSIFRRGCSLWRGSSGMLGQLGFPKSDGIATGSSVLFCRNRPKEERKEKCLAVSDDAPMLHSIPPLPNEPLQNSCDGRVGGCWDGWMQEK